jgi:predicted nucleic acid-binding protein
MRAAAQGAGCPILFANGQIAAVASILELPLATRNVKDFAVTGVRMVSSWNVG